MQTKSDWAAGPGVRVLGAERGRLQLPAHPCERASPESIRYRPARHGSDADAGDGRYAHRLRRIDQKHRADSDLFSADAPNLIPRQWRGDADAAMARNFLGRGWRAVGVEVAWRRYDDDLGDADATHHQRWFEHLGDPDGKIELLFDQLHMASAGNE